MATAINLYDEQWMSILDQTRDGLPACCGNLSELRDRIFSIVRNGCEVSEWEYTFLARAFWNAQCSHDLPNLTVWKVHEQMMENCDQYNKMYTTLAEYHKDLSHEPQKEL